MPGLEPGPEQGWRRRSSVGRFPPEPSNLLFVCLLCFIQSSLVRALILLDHAAELPVLAAELYRDLAVHVFLLLFGPTVDNQEAHLGDDLPQVVCKKLPELRLVGHELVAVRGRLYHDVGLVLKTGDFAVVVFFIRRNCQIVM